MKKTSTNKESGFTIIEVVLVLAIAGLIFLVVFLALPALQRSQRDTQRRSDLGRFMAQLETYASNNNGSYPTAANTAAFVTNYLTNDGASFSDPQNDAGTPGVYDVVTLTGAAAPTIDDNLDNIFYRINAQCGASEGTFQAGSGTRSVAAMIAVENGIAFCQDNR